jgi:uncharacterized protein (TIGR02453 family)
MSYAGLPRTTTDFLAGLEANNSRDWFEAHRAEYERDWLGAGLDLVTALSAPCAALTPPLLAVPKLNASLRRIHRDVRFSRDKRPYEPRLHLILSSGPDFNKVPGVHLVISAKGFGFGAGHYGFAPAQLDAYRRRVSNPDGRAEFLAVLARAETTGARLDPPDLTRVPKGFEAADWDLLIRRKSLILRTGADRGLPEWLFTPDAPTRLMQTVAALNPLTHWITQFL